MFDWFPYNAVVIGDGKRRLSLFRTDNENTRTTSVAPF